MLALHWLAQGYGYEIAAADVWDAYQSTLDAAARHGSTDPTKERIRKMLATESAGNRFVRTVLGFGGDPDE